MEDAAFSDEFCRFIHTTITSVDAAELLLVLAGAPTRWWEPMALGEVLRPATTLSETDVRRYLEQFQAAGLIAIGPDRLVQYRPGNDGVARHVAMLAQAYQERPVTLIRMIYALRDFKIQSFADAFKLKRS